MDSVKWAKFFELLKEIATLPGTYIEKAGAVDTAAEESDSIDELEEFLSWYE